MSEQPESGPDVDYRWAPSPFAALEPSERRVAWTVLRTLATAAWWAAGAWFVGWLVLAGIDGTVPLLRLLPLLGLAAAAAVLEVRAGSLKPEPPARGRASS